jgi:hypothetical protein
MRILTNDDGSFSMLKSVTIVGGMVAGGFIAGGAQFSLIGALIGGIGGALANSYFLSAKPDPAASLAPGAAAGAGEPKKGGELGHVADLGKDVIGHAAGQVVSGLPPVFGPGSPGTGPHHKR